jgi:uncharacterized membrane protein
VDRSGNGGKGLVASYLANEGVSISAPFSSSLKSGKGLTSRFKIARPTSMNSKHPLLPVVSVLFIFPWCQAFAGSSVIFEILTSFNYPNGDITYAAAVNDKGDVVGEVDSDNYSKAGGFLRSNDGQYSTLIYDPAGDLKFTILTGINNFRTACGAYRSSDSHNHGFVLSGFHMFTPFDIDGATDTFVFGINDAGNLCGGSFGPAGPAAWVSIDGTVSTFTIPGSIWSCYANGINKLNQSVGTYAESGVSSHGFFRQADGTLVYPIDVPGAVSTSLYGINEQGQIVGNMDDGARLHGVFYASLDKSPVIFDYPNRYHTGFTGINARGMIVGWGQPLFTQQQSFLVRARLAPGL